MIFPSIHQRREAEHKKRKRIKRMSKLRAVQMAEYAKVKSKFLSEHVYCVKCNDFIEPKYRQLHHWAGRTGALLCWVPGFRMLDGGCHSWVESHRNDAVSLGLRAPDNLFARPRKLIVQPKCDLCGDEDPSCGMA